MSITRNAEFLLSTKTDLHLKKHTRTEAKRREYTRSVHLFFLMVFCGFVRMGVWGRQWHLSITESAAVKTPQEEKRLRRETKVERVLEPGKDKETQEGEQKRRRRAREDTKNC